MRNVTISSAVSYELFMQTKAAAQEHHVSTSSLIQLAIRLLLSHDPAEVKAMLSKEGRGNG